MLICPKCKLLYEKSTHCIRCGSPLVERTSSEKEEMKAEPSSEINEETRVIQETKDIPPLPIPKAEKGEPETESIVKIGKDLHEVTADEQGSSEIFPKQIKRQVSRSGKFQIRVPSPSYRYISIVILILIGGYLLWSIYSHVSLKKPDTNASPSRETISLLPSRPTTSTKSMTPPMEPKIVTSEEIEKETPVFPSAPSVPTTLKTPVSDRKEIENITNLFENIRQANLKKNIDLFMSCYSAGFNDREGKKRETLKNWENFTYINLSYNLKEHTISGDTAGIRVEWVIHFYPKEGNQPQESKTVLDVTLNREPDGWKIKNIKAIG